MPQGICNLPRHVCNLPWCRCNLPWGKLVRTRGRFNLQRGIFNLPQGIVVLERGITLLKQGRSDLERGMLDVEWGVVELLGGIFDLDRAILDRRLIRDHDCAGRCSNLELMRHLACLLVAASLCSSARAQDTSVPKTEDQIVADFKKYIDEMQPLLPQLFGLLPESPVTVEGIPDFDKAAATHYVRGTPDGKRELGKEVGLYKDPISDYGRLSSELFRAVRLVVDTGIHNKGWTRDHVIAFMRENDVNEVVAQTETDRYIARPAQALAYKMGQLKIRELRERAKLQLTRGADG